jgi:hypothetical protein
MLALPARIGLARCGDARCSVEIVRAESRRRKPDKNPGSHRTNFAGCIDEFCSIFYSRRLSRKLG